MFPCANDTLYSRIKNKLELSQSEIDSLVAIFGKYCKLSTKQKLYFTLSSVPYISSYRIYDRVILSPRVSYCPGWNFPEEIKLVRKLLSS